jgi:hypothetical protein
VKWVFTIVKKDFTINKIEEILARLRKNFVFVELKAGRRD